MSEGTSPLFTQPLIPSDSTTYVDGGTVVGCRLTQEKKQAAEKPRFVDFACNHSEVGAGCTRILIYLPLVTGQPVRSVGHGRRHPKSALGREGEL